jgi:hypothetical protein
MPALTRQLHEPDGIDPRKLLSPDEDMDLTGPKAEGVLSIVE